MPGNALPPTVRCFHCGARHDPTLPACPDCASSFRRLCACDTQVNAYAERCPACDLLQHPPSYRPPARGRRLLGLLFLVVMLAGIGVAALLQRSDERQDAKPWDLKQQAQERMRAKDWETARKDLESVTERFPGDAEAWYMLAHVDRELGFDRETYRAHAVRAVELNDNLPQPMAFLASDHLAAGEFEDARQWAARAAALDAAGPHTWRLVGELELRRTRPDLARALSAFERVYEDPTQRDAELLARLAALRIRVLGFVPRERFPASVRRALDEAEEAFARLDEEERDAPALLPLRIEIQLALGRNPAARGLADRALERVGEDGDATLRARLLALRGRSFLQLRDESACMADFAAALALSPTGPAVTYCVDYLDSAGRAELADSLLATAAPHDPDGCISSARARRALATGQIADARRHLDAARERSPEDLDLNRLDAAVLQAEGDFEGARVAYDALVAASPAGDSARYDRALLSLAEPLSLSEREAAVRQSLESLLAEAGLHEADALYQSTIGALLSALGRDEEAVAALERATALQPWNPQVWYEFGEVLRAAVELPEAPERASDAYTRAASLRPHDAGLVSRVASALWADDPAQAAGVCSAYLSAHPEDLSVRRLRAEAYRLLGHWRSVAEDLQYLLDADGLTASELEVLVGAYARIGRLARVPDLIRTARAAGHDRRAQVLERALAVERGEEPPSAVAPEGAAPSVTRALGLISAGKIEEARGVLRSALAERPGTPDAVRVLVLCLFTGDGATPEGIAECRDAVARLPEDASRGLAVFLKGCLLLADGSIDLATRTLRQATEARPDDPLAAFAYGQALFAAGRLRACLPAFRRSLLTDRSIRSPMPEAVSERLTAVALRIDDTDRRERLLREALSLDSANLRATEALYALLSARGAFQRAGDVAEQALRHTRGDDATERLLRRRAITARMASGDLDGALAHLEQLDTDGPDAVILAALRGWVLVETGEHEAARKVFEEAISRDPRSRVAAQGLIHLLVRIDNLQAARGVASAWRRASPGDDSLTHILIDLLARMGHRTAALDEAREAVARAPDDVLALHLLIWLYELEGSPDDALGVARASLATCEEAARPERELLLAELQLRLHHDPAGPLDVARRLAAQPDVDDAVRRQAALLRFEALLASGDVTGARAACDRFVAGWVDDRPTTPVDERIEHRVRFVQGVLALRGGDVASANARLTRCLELDPSHHAAMNNLAWVLAQETETAPRALALAQAATRGAPQNPDYWDTLALCAQAAGEGREAERCYRIAIELFARVDPPRPADRGASALSLALLLRRTGRDEQARTLAEEILEYAPGTPAALGAADVLRR